MLLNSLRSLVKKTVKAELLEYCQLPDISHNNQLLDLYLQEINAAHFHLYQAGGKLVRPLLLVLTAGCFGGARGVSNALSPAAAVECAHTYSLVHDDMPCMDNDSLRRGQPTVHTVYGEAKGLLVGDGLLTASFEILSNSRSLDKNLKRRSDLILQLMQIFSNAVSMNGMIFGQWLDISEAEFQEKLFSQTSEEIWQVFQTIHQNKTGKLFAACLVMGFLCGVFSSRLQDSVNELERRKRELFQIGLDIGMVFQVMDDILDVTQAKEQLGKTAQKDITQNKLTAVSLLGLEAAQEYANKLTKKVCTNFEGFIQKNTIPSELSELSEQKEYFKELLEFFNILKMRRF